MRLGLVLLALVVASCTPPVVIHDTKGGSLPPERISDNIGANEVSDLFERVVFNGEDGKSWPLARWEKPITISVFPNGHIMPYPKLVSFTDLAHAKLSQIAALTGREVVFLPDNDNSAGMKIIVVKDQSFWPKETNRRPSWGEFWGCGFVMSEDDEIAYGIAYLNIAYDSDSPEEVEACMIEEPVQGLGIPGYVDSANGDIAETIFNDRVNWTDLTPIDKIILRTLYDPRLKPGMSREQAMPIARQIIAELVLEARR